MCAGGVGSTPAHGPRLWRSSDMSTVRVPIHSRKFPNLFALVDEEDAELVLQYRWNVTFTHRGTESEIAYARARVSKPDRWIFLHRLIMGDPKGFQVDHENGDGLDCRRDNLRKCLVTGNNQNRRGKRGTRSRFCGVFFRTNSNRWQAQIAANKRKIHLGTFDSEEEAARAYDRAARTFHGRFAAVNFPLPGERCAVTPD